MMLRSLQAPQSALPSASATATAPALWRVAINFAAFQLAWFACVAGAARGTPWLGVFVAMAAVAAHASISARPRRELVLVLVAIAFGAVYDSSIAALGWITYNSGEFVPGIAPHWILALWALFATTLNVSLRWLRGRRVAAALVGAVAGPLSYYAGERLGALVLVEPVAATLALAVGWAIFTPVLIEIAQRCDGVCPVDAS
ncbi:MAG: DUF2878 domain-containing protein [Pseudomonadota bacterium]|nr:DUF2878 domain-containing protein [Pseudomonadota bacterium]